MPVFWIQSLHPPGFSVQGLRYTNMDASAGPMGPWNRTKVGPISPPTMLWLHNFKRRMRAWMNECIQVEHTSSQIAQKWVQSLLPPCCDYITFKRRMREWMNAFKSNTHHLLTAYLNPQIVGEDVCGYQDVLFPNQAPNSGNATPPFQGNHANALLA
jgi:hypothetical protein